MTILVTHDFEEMCKLGRLAAVNFKNVKINNLNSEF